MHGLKCKFTNKNIQFNIQATPLWPHGVADLIGRCCLDEKGGPMFDKKHY